MAIDIKMNFFFLISTEWKNYDIENGVAAENKPSSFGEGSAMRFKKKKIKL